MIVIRSTQLVLAVIALAALASAAERERATVLRETPLYSAAGANSQRLQQVQRGRDLAILDRNTADGQPWVKISLAADEKAQVSQEISGWISAQTLITASVGNGDQIIFGQAVASEHEAEERGGRKGAA